MADMEKIVEDELFWLDRTELYGMIWYLANQYHATLDEWMRDEWHEGAGFTVAEAVEEARQKYKQGLELSPGLNALTEEEED